jgi:homoserine kinase
MEVEYPQSAIAYAPATVANLNVGFDILGLALEHPMERMGIRRLCGTNDVIIRLPLGSNLPLDPLKNVAGRSALSVLEKAKADFGIELEIEKTILPGSGIGSSASSAVAATVGVNALLTTSLSDQELLACALDGEQVASGARHHDNVAPALKGGLVFSSPNGEIISLPAPRWHIVILHPQVEVKTAQSRALLPTSVDLTTVAQSIGWMGHFIHACHLGDSLTAAQALQDLFIGPARTPLIPKLEECRAAALKVGAISGGISGSGPSSFWICLDQMVAAQVENVLVKVMREADIDCKTYLSEIASQGAYAVSQS